MLKDTKCVDFNVDELEINPLCPHCQFPTGNYAININSTISNMDDDFDAIKQSWENHIIEEIGNNQGNIKNLDHEERRLVQSIFSQGYLPSTIDETVVKAINNLLEDLEIKEIDLNELQRMLTEDTDVLKVDDFRERIERYIDGILPSENINNIRLRIKGFREE